MAEELDTKLVRIQYQLLAINGMKSKISGFKFAALNYSIALQCKGVKE